MRRPLATATSWLPLLALASPPPETFDWHSITPTAHLVYHACYSGLRCARLAVPLDWNNSSAHANATAALAIAVQPAAVPPAHPAFGGTVVTNPGGPGGSGVAFVRRWGGQLRALLDRDRRYEVLSFDPRGVGDTTPRADCFGEGEAQVLARDAWLLEMRGAGGLGGLRRRFAGARAYGGLCAGGGGGEGLRHMSTAVVARDMVEIVDRVEELRRKERKRAKVEMGRKMEAWGGAQKPVASDELDGEDEEEDEAKKEVARIQYLGFSYGTVLGNTFMSMFPGRVGRMIIDGVVDMDDYMKGMWEANLYDTEKIVDYFYSTCFDAGKKCPLYHKGDTGGSDIQKRVDKFIADVDEAPLSLVRGNDILTITGNDIRESFHIPLYFPFSLFEAHARKLAAALAGDLSPLAAGLNAPKLRDACTTAHPNGTAPATEADETYAIACSDAEAHADLPVAHYAAHVARLTAQSDTLGALVAAVRFLCSGWRVRPAWRFAGPFVSPPPDRDRRRCVPEAPMLILSNRLDPITPLANAFKTSGGHPGSSVVVQESVGHCALASSSSQCTLDVVRDYLEFGVVPKNGTSCASSCTPWRGDQCGFPLVAAEGVEGVPWLAGRGRPLTSFLSPFA